MSGLEEISDRRLLAIKNEIAYQLEHSDEYAISHWAEMVLELIAYIEYLKTENARLRRSI